MNKFPTWFFSNRRRGESHPKSKLTNEQVLQIRELYKQGYSLNLLSRNYGVSSWTIREVVDGKTWKHI
jgi:lambda repressor-like predicted transcriptional regulator